MWSALLVMLSLISFILFEIYKTYVQTRSLLGRAKILEEDSLLSTRLNVWKVEEHARQIKFGRIWARTFWFTLLTGLAGGSVLIYSFMIGLIRSYWPG